MRSMTFGALLVAILAIGISSSVARSQDDKKPAGMPSEQEMQAMMEAMAKVGPEHEQLKQHFAGTWDAQVTAYWGPSPEKSTATMKSEMMLGDRYVHSHYRGTAMGQPFEGAAVMGYDNMKQKYFNTWMDSMSTGIMVSEGTYDSASKTYRFEGSAIGPDGKECTVRQETRIESNDRHVFTMYGPGMDGKEAKMMEIVYTRKS